jgi:pimeloyl-ACP methyl ester carboxylesterase
VAVITPDSEGNTVSDKKSRQQHVCSADGTSIAVTVTGRGRPLVVAPGSLSTAQDWQPVADALAPHFTTYAVDRRGHGASGDNPDFSIEREQQDIAAVLELAGHDAILLAHSYGAVVALGLALNEAPAAVIVYEPPVPIGGPVAGEALAPFERAVDDGDLDGALTLGLRHLIKMDEPVIEMIRNTPLWAPRAALTPTWGRELRAIDAFGPNLTRFGTLTMPTLLIIGELSPPWLVDTSRQLQQAIPDSRLAVIGGQAHDAHLGDPEALASVILTFVGDLAPRADEPTSS